MGIKGLGEVVSDVHLSACPRPKIASPVVTAATDVSNLWEGCRAR